MIDEGLNIPRPDLNDTERLVNVIFPAIVLELGPPPSPIPAPVGFRPVNHKPPRGLGAGQMRESTRVGSKGPAPAPRVDDAGYWDYRENVYGLLRYRYNSPAASQHVDSFFDWCQRQEQL